MSATDFKILVGKKVGNTNGTFAPTGQISQLEIRDGRVVTGSNSLLVSGGGGTVTQVSTGSGLTGGPITSTGTISLAPSGVTAGSYGSSGAIPVLAVDTFGRITSASTSSVSLPASGVTAGSYFPDTNFTVNAQGIITSATQVNRSVLQTADLTDTDFLGGMTLRVAITEDTRGFCYYEIQSVGGPGGAPLGGSVWTASSVPVALQARLPTEDTHFMVSSTAATYLLRLGPSGISIFSNPQGGSFSSGGPGPSGIFRQDGAYHKVSPIV